MMAEGRLYLGSKGTVFALFVGSIKTNDLNYLNKINSADGLFIRDRQLVE
jgi:hypothetical protein